MQYAMKRKTAKALGYSCRAFEHHHDLSSDLDDRQLFEAQ